MCAEKKNKKIPIITVAILSVLWILHLLLPPFLTCLSPRVTESRCFNPILHDSLDHVFKQCKMSGRGNTGGSNIPRLSDQSNSRAPQSNRKQCQRCRNDCVKEFMKCAVCEFVFYAKCEGVTSQQFNLFRELDKLKAPFEWLCSTVQPRYNAPHYSEVFSITRSCHGSQNDYFAICLL